MEDKNRKEFIRQVFNTVCEQYGTGSLRFFENAASHLPALLNLNPYGHNSPWLATKTVGANSFAQCA
ncbi:hypothetical protein BMS3Bbin11_00500 [bacterium BMS3Bbin11]|nr:hypothetical protein BMS3Abin11_00914 [bacterium BMS3Abin11]GBE45413.1 hypothetical protein BMS3Bbin11_00500 [bacterium BMS3Bbin11]GMT40388.1 MAG: hypothetical protein IEMM0001_1123 [bacterium]HDH16120.1 hypothetical protein [Gammaproteobacteria bacterium]